MTDKKKLHKDGYTIFHQNGDVSECATYPVDLKKKESIFTEETKCLDFDEDCDDDICPTSCWLNQPERGWCPLLNQEDIK